MRKTVLTLVAALVTACAALAQASQPQASWSDSTRDVYINGELDRTAQMLFNDSPRRYALHSSKLDRAIILDLTEHSVSTMAKEAFRFAADRSTATTDAGASAQAAGRYTGVDGSTYLFAVDGKYILIRSHPGVTGDISKEKIFETVPVWRSLMEGHQPKAETVAALKASDKEATITIAVGTWCSDSKNYVPKLLKALQAAANPRLQVKLIGVDNQFHEPTSVIQKRRLVNVPTVIVEQGSREIGRIVETPAAETFEEDLAAILSGKPNTHIGRWDRGQRLARGAYSYRDSSGKERGTESWELYSTSEGGFLAHSEIKTGGEVVEVWHRTDGRRRPTFVEVTRRRGDDVLRTRYRLNEQSFTARFRSNHAGIIEQTLSVPDRLAFSSRAAATEGWGWTQASEAGEQNQITSYQAPLEFDSTAGSLAEISYQGRGEENVRVPAGQFRAKHVVRSRGKDSTEMWLHTELQIPVRGITATGLEYVLTSLEAMPAK